MIACSTGSLGIYILGIMAIPVVIVVIFIALICNLVLNPPKKDIKSGEGK